MSKFFLDTEFIEGFHKPLFGKRRHFIDLISIGIVAEDGSEYYAISNEFDLREAWSRCDGPTLKYWIRDNVLRPIYDELLKKERYAREYHSTLIEPFSYRTLKNLIKWNGKSNKQIAEDIKDFCKPRLSHGTVHMDESKPTERHYFPTEFYAYYGDYDWVLFCSLFGRMIDLPEHFPMYCKDLKQMLDEKVSKLDIMHITRYLYTLVGSEYQFRDKLPVGKDISGWSLANKLELVKVQSSFPKQQDEHNALSDARWNKELYEFINKL